MIRGIGAVDPGRRRRRPSIVCSNADCGVISGGPVASGGVRREGKCAAVRYEMLSFCRRADIYYRAAKLPGVVAVGWLRKPFQLVGHSFRPLARVLG